MEKTSCLDRILEEYKNLSQTRAIAIGGSSANNTSDKASDIDVYVFVSENIPTQVRLDLTKKYSSNYEVGGEYFGAGDEFWVDEISQQLDVMFWDINWFESSINNVWGKHYPSNGYTTCFLHTLKNFKIICDTDNWLKSLQNKLKSPYPKELKENIIKRNMMLMKDKPFASYYEQIEKALAREDFVSVGHRISAFLASYFDVLFAKNEILHPGEKRLINFAKNNCKILPKNFEEDMNELLTQPNPNTLLILTRLVKELRIIEKN